LTGELLELDFDAVGEQHDNEDPHDSFMFPG
jgi:hypothetical protein